MVFENPLIYGSTGNNFVPMGGSLENFNNNCGCGYKCNCMNEVHRKSRDSIFFWTIGAIAFVGAMYYCNTKK